MSRRIDVQTLVLAFENRIAILEKNPPELVSQKTISLMLENALEEEIKNHFSYIIKLEIKNSLKKKFKELRFSYLDSSLHKLLDDEEFQNSLIKNIKYSIIENIKLR